MRSALDPALFAAAFLGLATACHASSEATSEAAAPGKATAAEATSEEAQERANVLYALGISLARNLEPFSLTPEELSHVVRGLEDGIAGREPAVDIRAYGGKLRQLAETRLRASAEAERKASAAFVVEAASRDGAETTESGLVYRSIEEGSGPSPTASDQVRVHYHGTLRDGTVFDSSVERGEPVTFPLGRVIPCWTEALQKMHVGGKAEIVCPAEIAYGDRGAPPHIKPGAALRFEVELLDIVQEP